MKKPAGYGRQGKRGTSHHQHRGMKAPEVKKKMTKGKVVWLIVGIIFAIILIAGMVAYSYVHRTIDSMNQVEVNEDNLAVQTDANRDNVINIALYGIDEPEGTTGRSDAIMILTIDNNNKKMKLTSVMRDSYVNIEGHGMDKITHAYAFGGPELAIKTLNQNFGLNITQFASVNFTSMPQIIDMLGGVDIEISAEEASTGQVPGISAAGTYTLNGEQALAYSRIRYASGNDFKRTERQRTVLSKMMTKIVQQPTSSFPTLAAQLAPLVTTNMSSSDIIGMATSYGTLAKQGIQQMRFPLDGDSEGKMIDGVYYLTFDLATESQKMQDWIFNNIDPE